MTTSVGAVSLDFYANTAALDRAMLDIQQRALLSAKFIESQFGRKLFLKPVVDDSALTALNKHLDLKQKHFKEVDAFMRSHPLTPKVDARGLDVVSTKLHNISSQLLHLQQIQATIRIAGGVKDVNNVAPNNQSLRITVDDSKLTSSVEKISNSIKKVVPKTGLMSGITNALTAPLRAAQSVIGSSLQGVFLGVGLPLGQEIGSGVRDGIAKESSHIIGSFKLISSEIASGLTEEIIRALGNDAVKIQQIIGGIVGENKIATEAASGRFESAKAQRRTGSQAGNQIINEVEDLTGRRGEILGRASQLQSRRSNLSAKTAALQKSIRQYQERLGVTELETRVSTLTNQLGQIANSSSKDPSKAIDLQGVAKKLQKELDNVIEKIERISEETSGRFRAEISELNAASEDLVVDEAAFAKLLSPFQQIDSIKPVKNRAGVNRQQHSRVQNLPEYYQRVAHEVFNASGVTTGANMIPRLVVSNQIQKGQLGSYKPGSNEIHITKEAYAAVEAGKLTMKQLETLIHELRHAAQFDFGKVAVGEKAAVDLLRPNSAEVEQFGREIEGSVAIQDPKNQDFARAVEADAYTFASRVKETIARAVNKSFATSQFEQKYGIGGSKTLNALSAAQKQALLKLQSIKQLIESHGGNVQAEIVDTISAIEQIQNRVKPIIARSRGIEALSPQDIEQLQTELTASFNESIELVNQQIEQFKVRALAKLHSSKNAPGILPKKSGQPSSQHATQVNTSQQDKKVDQILASAPPAQKSVEPGITQFKQNLDAQYTSQGLRQVANRLGYANNNKRNKNDIIELIANAPQQNVDAIIAQLGDSIKKKQYQTGQSNNLPKVSNESGISEKLKATNRTIQNTLRKLESAQGEERKELIKLILTATDKQIAWIDTLTNQNQLTGKTRQRLSGHRNYLEQTRAPLAAEIIGNNPLNRSQSRTNINQQGGNSLDQLAAFDNLQNEVEQLIRGLLNQGATSVRTLKVKGFQGRLEKMGEGSTQQDGSILPTDPLDNPPPFFGRHVGKRRRNGGIRASDLARETADPEAQAQLITARAERALIEFERAENQINRRLSSSNQRVGQSIASIGQGQETIRGRIFNVLKNSLNEGQFSWLLKAKDYAKQFLGVFLGFHSLQFVANLFNQISKATLDAAVEFEGFERKLTFASGSADKGAKNLKFIRDEANRLKVDLRSSLESAASLTAATRDTPLEGEPTRQIQSAVLQASSVYGLNPQAQERVSLAVQQMAGKGVVSAEELRQQLGESLPGAFNIAARAMGVTTQQLNKMLERGQILTEDFLPKFAQQLSAETAGGVAGAAKSSQAAVNSFNNSLYELQVSLGKGLLPARNFGLDVLSSGINLVTAASGLLTRALGFLAIVVAGKLWQALGSFTISLLTNRTALIALGAAMPKLIALVKQLGLQFLVFTAITDTVAMFGKAFSDAGGQIREFADAATNGLEKYRIALAEARNSQVDFMSTLPKSSNDVQGESLLEDTLVGNVAGLIAGKAGKEFVGNAERGIQQTLGLRTYATKQLDDKTVATGDLITSTYTTLNESKTLRGADGKGIAELATLQVIDKKLDELQTKRRALLMNDPGNKAGLKLLKEEEEQLLKNRQIASKPIGLLQGEMQARIDALKAALEEYDQMAAKKQVDQETYKTTVGQLKEALKQAEAEQDKFNKLIRGGVDALSLLERRLQNVSDRLADANDRTTAAINKAKSALALSEASGTITPGQSQYQSALLDQEALRQKIADTNAAIKEQRALLDTPENAQILTSFGVDINKVGANELKTLATRATTPKEKLLFEQYSTLKQKELEVTDLEFQLNQRKVDTTRQIYDLNKQVAEYYRAIQRTAAEIALSAKEATNNSAVSNAKNKLKTALLGFSDNFVSQFVESLVGILDTLNEPVQQAIEAQKQILQNNNAYQDLVRQGQEQQRQSPISGDGGGGDAINTGSYTIYSGNRANTSVSQVAKHHEGGSYSERSFGGKSEQFLGDRLVKDIVLAQNGNQAVPVPSPVAGIARLVNESESGSYGNLVEILNSQGQLIARLAHLASFAPSLQSGSQVAYGQTVGIQGNTGDSSGTHLHVELPPKVFEKYFKDLRRGLFTSGSAGTSPGTSSPPATNSNASNTLTRLLHIIAAGESGFNPQAQNTNVPLDTRPRGAFQFIPSSRQRLIQLTGLDPWAGDLSEQAAAAAAWIPKVSTQAQTAIEQGDINKAISLLNKQWTSLPGGKENMLWQGARGLAELQRYVSGNFTPKFSLLKGQKPTIERGSFVPSSTDTGQQAQTLGTEAANQNLQQQNQIAIERARSSGLGALLEASLQEQRAQRALKQGYREQQDAVLSSERRVEDMGAEIGYSTPQKQYAITVRDINRKYFDNNKDLLKQRDSLEDTLGISQTLIKIFSGELKSGKLSREQTGLYQRSLKELEPKIPGTRESLAKVNNLLQQGSKLRDRAFYDAFKKYVDEEGKRRAEAASEITRIGIASLRSQAEAAELGDITLGDPLKLRASADQKEKLLEFDEKIRSLEEMARTSGRTGEEIDKLRLGLLALKNIDLSKIEQQTTLALAKRVSAFLEQQQQQLIELEKGKASLKQGDPLFHTYRANTMDEDLTHNRNIKGYFEQFRRREISIKDVFDLSANDSQRHMRQQALNRKDYDTGFFERLFGQRQRLFQSNQDLLGARSGYLKTKGLGIKAQQLDKEVAVAGQNFSYESAIREINKLVESKEIAIDKAQQLKTDLEAINQIKLADIQAQFDPWNQALVDVQSGFQNFLSGILSGSQSIGDAFKGMISSIASSLASMAALWAANSIFSSVFGVGKSANKSSDGGFLDSLFGRSVGGGSFPRQASLTNPVFGIADTVLNIAGFKDGGVVDAVDHSDFRKGNNAIAAALKKEGPRGVLAALTPGEIVLNLEQSRKYHELGVSKVLNFRDGGVVPGGSMPSFNAPSTSGGSINVNVPVSINSNGGTDKDLGRTAAGLGQALKAVVIQEIQNQKRSGGLLQGI